MSTHTLVTRIMFERIVPFARARGVDPEPLLVDLGLPPRPEIDEGFFPLDKALSFYARISEALDDPHLGLHLATAADAPGYGVYGYLFANAPSFGDALAHVSTQLTALWADQVLQVFDHEDPVRVVAEFIRPLEGAWLWNQELLATLVMHARSAGDPELTPTLLTFTHAALDPEPFERLLGVTPTFDAAQDALGFRRSDLATPHPAADPQLLQHLLDAAEHQLDRRREALGVGSQLIRLMGCTVDLRTGVVHRTGEPSASLTPKELEIVDYFTKRANQVVPRERLERDLWNIGPSTLSHAPAVAIRRLRQKIEPNPRHPVNLITVFGEGWRLVMPESEPPTDAP